MVRSDPIRVAAAQINGLAAAYADVKRLDRATALVEIAEIVARLPAAHRAEALARSVEGYLVPGRLGGYWHRAAVDLLAEAGADLEWGRRLAAEPRQTFTTR